MRRWVRGLGALLALIAGLVLAPTALLAWGHYPRVDWSLLLRPSDGTLLLVVLTAVGWLAWSAFALSTAAELARIVSRNRLRILLPSLGGVQALSASLLFAVVSLAATAEPAVAQSAPVAALPSAAVLAPASPQGTVAAVETGAAPAGSHYLVSPGDDLWTIADDLLGDGGRWRELVSANPEVLADPTRQLVPGTRLAVPTGPDIQAPSRRVLVEPGDTLSGLAEEHLGRASLWPRIEEANSELISDPDHIEAGWRLVVPGSSKARGESRSNKEAGAAQPEAARRTPEPTSSEPDGTESSNSDDKAVDPAGPAKATVAGLEPRAVSGEADGAQPKPAAPDSADSAGAAPDSADSRADSRTDSDSADSRVEPVPVASQDAALAPESGLEADEGPVRGVLGGLSAVCAAAVVGGLELRRALQLRARPVGRRMIQPPASAARVRTALGRRQKPDRLAALEAALRSIGLHCHRTGAPAPPLSEVLVSDERITFAWRGPVGDPPSGFTGSGLTWTLVLPSDNEELALDPMAMDHPCPYPALVTLGRDADGASVMVDAERSGILGVAADDADLRRGAVAAMAVELACAPWSGELLLRVIGADAGLAAAAGGDRVRPSRDVAASLAELQAVIQDRRAALGSEDVRALRCDPERAEAVAPQVFIFTEALDAETQDEIDSWLAETQVGVAVLAATSSQGPAQWQLSSGTSQPQGRRAAGARPLQPQVIPAPTREAIRTLFDTANSQETTTAPWWSGSPDTANVLPLHPRPDRLEETVDIVRLRHLAPAHPELLLIGPVDIIGTAGPDPTRSRQQLLELCGWLLENPGLTSTAMASAMLIAEGTRRSNMSRLRSWLGCDPDGKPYLPDAYSGRIRLHPEVSCDWHRLQILLGPGIDRVGDSTLVAALDLVRGAPMADAAPGQWHWAEELRTDISSVARDVGVVLVERALKRGDLDLARWAAGRALLAAPEDELLVCARIRTEYQAGNRADVERLVMRLTQHARELEVDLLPESIALCQQVIEGRPRARRA